MSSDTQFCHSSVVELVSYITKLRDDKIYDKFIQLTVSPTISRSSDMKQHMFVDKGIGITSSNYYNQTYFEVLNSLICIFY